MSVLGIDPGTRGGLAVLSDNAGIQYVAGFYPEMPAHELAHMLTTALAYNPRGVFLEKVGHKRGDGSKGSFTFGGAYRLIEGILLGKGVKPRYVHPTFWQARMECLSGGNKAVTLARAKFLFGPLGLRITHDIADALLIAEYGRRCL